MQGYGRTPARTRRPDSGGVEETSRPGTAGSRRAARPHDGPRGEQRRTGRPARRNLVSDLTRSETPVSDRAGLRVRRTNDGVVPRRLLQTRRSVRSDGTGPAGSIQDGRPYRAVVAGARSSGRWSGHDAPGAEEGHQTPSPAGERTRVPVEGDTPVNHGIGDRVPTDRDRVGWTRGWDGHGGGDTDRYRR